MIEMETEMSLSVRNPFLGNLDPRLECQQAYFVWLLCGMNTLFTRTLLCSTAHLFLASQDIISK